MEPNGGLGSNGNGNGNGNTYPKYVKIEENLPKKEKKRRQRQFLLSEKDKYKRTYEKARDRAKYNYDESRRNILTDDIDKEVERQRILIIKYK
jgi:CHASE3 domain sensor protein